MSKSADKFRGFDYVTKVHLELQDLVFPPPSNQENIKIINYGVNIDRLQDNRN